MNIIKHFILFLGALSATADDAQKVLIIGNSYTFYNDLPQVLEALSKKTKAPLRVESYTAGAMSLRGFLDDPAHAKAKQLVESGDYDWLILQDQSQTPAYKPDETMASVERWSNIAQKHGTKVLLFLTWAHASNNGGKIAPLMAMQEQTSTTYCQAAIANKAKVAPVGEAWARWYKKNPNKPLHLNDLSHPNPSGTYLAACVIHASISGKPVKVSGNLHINKQTVLKVPKGTAKELQATANATVKDFSAKKYLAQLKEKENALPATEDIKAALHKGMSIKELKDILGAPIYQTKNDGHKSYQFKIRESGELVAYCNGNDIVENVSISIPNKSTEIIDLDKL